MKKTKTKFLSKRRMFDLVLPTLTTILFILSLPCIGSGLERAYQAGHEATEGNSVFVLSDGYLVLMNHAGQQNFTKFDLHGNVVFSRDFFDASGGWPRSGTQTSDGGYLIAGLLNTTPRKGYLIKLDQHLKAKWGKEFSQEGDIWIGSAKETADGGFVALARGEDFFEIIKLKRDGSMAWQKRIMTGGETEVHDIYEMNDGTEDGYQVFAEFDDPVFGRTLYLGAVERNGEAVFWQWALRSFTSGNEQGENGGRYLGASNVVRMNGSNFAVAAPVVTDGGSSILLIPFNRTGLLNPLVRISGLKDDWMGISSGGPTFVKLSDGNFLLNAYHTNNTGDKILPFLVRLGPGLSQILSQYEYTPGDCLKGQSAVFTGVSETETEEIIATGRTIGEDAEALLISFSKEGVNDQSCFRRSLSSFMLDTDIPIREIPYSSQLREGVILLSDILFPEEATKGIPLDIAPSTIDFGTVCGGASLPQRATFTNSFGSNVYIGSTIIQPPGIFQISNNACTSGLLLLPFVTTGNPMSCDVDVFFTPPSVGGFNGTLSVCYTTNPFVFGVPPVYDCSQTVRLLGTGGQPSIHVNPTTVNFGNVCIGGSSEQTVTVRNNGNCSASIRTTGLPPGPFSIVGGGCSNLSPGGSCTITVRFAPTSVGSFNASFSIASVNVTLTGTGTGGQPSIHVNPTTVNFGNVCIESSSEQTVTVRNDGDCPASIETTGLPPGPFSIVGGGCFHLSPGGSCTITVRFAPTSVGSFNASFSIASVNVALTGTAGRKDITIDPTHVDFGNVAKGEKSERTVAVANPSTCPIGVTLHGISAPELPFSIVGGTCAEGMVLQGGEGCSLIVRFSPTQAGSFSSSFNITSNDLDEPTVIVNLKGGSGPDVIGEFTSLDKKCRETGKGVRCTIKVVGTIKNIGTNVAPPCCARFYLSDGEGYQQGDPLLMQADTNGVRVGKSQTVKFNIPLPPGETGVGKYLTMVLNATHCFVEADEANNILSIPIP